MYIVYGKSNCPSCDSAKKLLKAKNLEFEYVDTLSSTEAIALFKENGWKSFPQVVVDGQHIGGVEALKKFLS